MRGGAEYIASGAGHLPCYECPSLQSMGQGPISRILPRRIIVRLHNLHFRLDHVTSSQRADDRLDGLLTDREHSHEIAFSYRSSARMQVFDTVPRYSYEVEEGTVSSSPVGNLQRLIKPAASGSPNPCWRKPPRSTDRDRPREARGRARCRRRGPLLSSVIKDRTYWSGTTAESNQDSWRILPYPKRVFKTQN